MSSGYDSLRRGENIWRARPSFPASRVFSLVWSTPLRRSLLITAVWRGIIAICGIVAYYVMPPGKADPFTLLHAGWSLNPFTLVIDSGIRNDAIWYADIARHGYQYSPYHMSSIGFYPLYPLLVRLLSLLAGNVYLAGMLISTVCMFLAVALLNVWLSDRGLGDRLPLATALLLAFPFSFFYAAMYTESLYLVLVLATFIWYERQRWWLAALCIFLAVLTRPTAVILPPTLLVLMLVSRRGGWKPWIPVVAGGLGILAFAAYQYVAFGTPMAYTHTHAGAPEYATMSRALQDLLLHARPGIPQWYLASNLGVGLLFLAAVPLVYRKLGPAYATFAALTVVLRLVSTLPGMERMVIVDFPVFVALACTEWRRFVFGYFVFGMYFVMFFSAAFAAHWSLF